MLQLCYNSDNRVVTGLLQPYHNLIRCVVVISINVLLFELHLSAHTLIASVAICTAVYFEHGFQQYGPCWVEITSGC